MGECTFTPRFGDFGDRRYILDIGGNKPEQGIEDRDEADPGSIRNGGSGVPTVRRDPDLTK